ncbi:hypothetical protein Cgig2_033897 [Carnegiea gigantea]|uniref:Uncharacterized protein n=1 Tax=Carnegiea gigantea TaxID=171969 RepID=A0A9Q1GKY3_9CARY|nr:hypothetical protein Cgig2_033897 [Carnegiea gigantea]
MKKPPDPSHSSLLLFYVIASHRSATALAAALSSLAPDRSAEPRVLAFTTVAVSLTDDVAGLPHQCFYFDSDSYAPVSFRSLRTPNLDPLVPRSEVLTSMGENELARLHSSMLIVTYHGFFQATWVAGIMLKQKLLEPPVPKAILHRPQRCINTSDSHKAYHYDLLCSSNIQTKVWDSAVSVFVSLSGFIDVH